MIRSVDKQFWIPKSPGISSYKLRIWLSFFYSFFALVKLLVKPWSVQFFQLVIKRMERNTSEAARKYKPEVCIVMVYFRLEIVSKHFIASIRHMHVSQIMDKLIFNHHSPVLCNLILKSNLIKILRKYAFQISAKCKNIPVGNDTWRIIALEFSQPGLFPPPMLLFLAVDKY